MLIKEWNKKTLLSKILTIIGFIVSITVIILAILNIFILWNNAIYVYEPLIVVLILIQAKEYWQKNKKVAYISLFAAIFIFIVTIVILFL